MGSKTLEYKLLQVGTDAEVFLSNAKTGKPFPVIGMLGGTKLCPLPVEELGKGFFIQEDNVMPEFNIPACSNAEDFVDSIGKMQSWLTAKMSAKGYNLAIVPSMVFRASQLENPQAQEVGCEPDFNVWTRKANPSPKLNPAMRTMRTAAAHIHVSFLVNDKAPEDIFQREAVVKALDLTVGLPSVILDMDKRRRELYGKAGAFRMKDYGIEHRVASNFWIRSPALQRWAFTGVQRAIELANRDKGSWLRNNCQNYGNHIQQAINEGQSGLAIELMQLFGITDRVVVQ